MPVLDITDAQFMVNTYQLKKEPFLMRSDGSPSSNWSAPKDIRHGRRPPSPNAIMYKPRNKMNS